MTSPDETPAGTPGEVHGLSFSNPASAAAGAAEGYVASLLMVLGDRDPMQVLDAQPGRLKEAVEGLDDAQVRIPEREGKWSVLGVLMHLADTERVYGYRIRMILSHDEPQIQGYDQDLWADRLHYQDGDPATAQAVFGLLRFENMALYRSLSEEEWERGGLHSERGRESVRTNVRLLAAHDLVHLNQIARIRKTIGA
jgi:hypothetical protein